MKSPGSWLKGVLRAHGIAATYLVRAAGVLAGFLSLGAAVALFLATQTDFKVLKLRERIDHCGHVQR